METTNKQTTVNTVETATTDLAVYDINVTRVNNQVTKVNISIVAQVTTTDASGMAVVSAQNVGNITYHNGMVSLSSMPADNNLPQYVNEVLEIINTIKEREV